MKTFINSEENEVKHLQIKINEAIKYAAKYNLDCAVFRSVNGYYFEREYRFCKSENYEFDIRFVAIARLCISKQRRKDDRKIK